MNRPHSNRTRLGRVLLAAVAALALLALPGIAAGHDRGHDQAGDAGTIQSFDPETGALAIDLAGGGSVSGLVTTRTRIRCGDDHGHHRGHHGHDLRRGRGATTSHDDDFDDDRGNRGPGSENSGRDDEPGEDTPGHDGTPPGSSENPGQGAEHSARCTSEDLVAGATVKVAELVLIDGKAIYAFVGLEPANEVTPAT
jgi:hypothetical protein